MTTMHFITMRANLWAIFLLAATAPYFAFAQDAPLSLDQILTTHVSVASFIDERDLDVASSVYRINDWEWNRRGARTLSDAIEFVPSLITLPTFGQGEAIAIRGFARNNSTRGTATLLDGIPINDFIIGSSQTDKANISLGILDNIQVIRGPGSVLYGTDAFHGVLSLNTFNAETDITKAQGVLSSNNFYQSALQHSGALTSNIRQQFAAGLSGQGDQHRGYTYTDPTDGLIKASERALEYNSQSLVYKLKTAATENTQYGVNLYFDSHRTREAPSVSRINGLSLGRDLDVANAHSEFGLLSLTREQSLNYGLLSNLTLWQWQSHQSFLFNRSRFTNDDHVDQNASQTHQGADFVLKESDASWLLNFSFRHQEITENRLDTIGNNNQVSSTLVVASNGLQRDIFSLAAMAKTPFFNDKLSFSYGIRQDYYSDFGNHTSPRLGVIFQPQANSAYKLLFSEAFRAPTAAEITNTTITLKPETIRTYEAVWIQQYQHSKYEWTLFHSDWKEGIVLIPTLTGSRYFNHQEHASNGLEFLYKLAWSRWNMETGFSYVISQDDTLDIEYVAFPKYIFNLGINYFLPSQSMTFSIFNHAYFDVKEGPITTAVPNPADLFPFWRVDLQVRKTFHPQYDAWVSVRNLFDRNNITPSIFNAEGGYLAEPMNISVGATYRF